MAWLEFGFSGLLQELEPCIIPSREAFAVPGKSH